MEKGTTGDSKPVGEMSELDLIKLLTLVASELTARKPACKAVPGDMDVALCNALFAVQAATQQALIANNCAGA